jgi:hypothetical protein
LGILYIQRNVVLDDFCGLFPLLYANGLFGDYVVNDNATNPTKAAILADGTCTVSHVPALTPLPTALLLTLLSVTGFGMARVARSY